MTNEVHIGKLKLGDNPLVVAVIGGDDIVTLAQSAKSDGADLIEIRLDLFEGIAGDSCDLSNIVNKIKEIKDKTKCPVLITVRRTLENGVYYVFNGSEERRLEIFKTIMPHVDAVDIEINASSIKNEVIACAREHNCAVIESYHNFAETEDYNILDEFVKEMLEDKADVIKLATNVLRREELMTLNKIFIKYFEQGEKITIVPQGSTYSLFRLIFPMMGSCLAYGYVSEKNAPGQLSVLEMKYMLNSNEVVVPVPSKALEYLQLRQ